MVNLLETLLRFTFYVLLTYQYRTPTRHQLGRQVRGRVGASLGLVANAGQGFAVDPNGRAAAHDGTQISWRRLKAGTGRCGRVGWAVNGRTAHHRRRPPVNPHIGTDIAANRTVKRMGQRRQRTPRYRGDQNNVSISGDNTVALFDGGFFRHNRLQVASCEWQVAGKLLATCHLPLA